MGQNLDLCWMLNAPHTLVCPKCGKPVSTRFNDYDIDLDSANPGPGIWSLRVYCMECEHEWHHEHNCGLPASAQEARQSILDFLDDVKIASTMATLQVPNGKACLSIVGKAPDGTGKVVASFEMEPFIKDLELALCVPPEK